MRLHKVNHLLNPAQQHTRAHTRRTCVLFFFLLFKSFILSVFRTCAFIRHMFAASKNRTANTIRTITMIYVFHFHAGRL